MNWTTDYPPNAMAQPQTQIGQTCTPVQTNAAKPSGLTAAIQSLVETAYESANLAENLASSLGLSRPCDGSDPAKPCSPIEYLRLATSVLCSANAKLTDALQHINS